LNGEVEKNESCTYIQLRPTRSSPERRTHNDSRNPRILFSVRLQCVRSINLPVRPSLSIIVTLRVSVISLRTFPLILVVYSRKSETLKIKAVD
jgi:hypothetical protein